MSEREEGSASAAQDEPAPRFGLVIVGDEILSGKRQDKHFAKVVEILAARGLTLSWAHTAGDDRAALTELYRRSFASGDVVLSCGGIGATPDDHTRQAAAAALGVPLLLHPEGAALIAERCAEMARAGKGSADMAATENRRRLKMAEFPAGSELIPNPFNRIAGFGIARHWFVPGFPVMAWPMLEWVLDTQYAAFFHARPQAERSFLVFEVAESAITPLMEAIEAGVAGVRAFSLPSVGDGRDGRPARRHVELGVKGDPAAVDAAFEHLREGIAALGYETASL